MKIRINQDVTFNWKLTVGGESVDLSKLELSVEITTPSNKKVEITPNIQFDTLEFNYRPQQIGEYILSAYLNRFKDGETALDIKAFEGVKYTWNQDFSIDDNLAANYVELAGDFNFGPNVPSAPDVPSVDLSKYAEKSYVDTQIGDEATARTQADSELQTKINDEATARTQADTELQSKINSKQDTLTAGENIKIENNVISAIDLRPSVDLSDYAKTTYVDTQINNEATARTQADTELQSKINTKQDKIIAGTGINITDNTISCTLDTTIFKVVDSLPGAPLSGDENKIHLVLSTNSEEGNAYDEYLWVNNSWEKIGSYIPSVDLSMYAEKSYVDSQIATETTARTQADTELQTKINDEVNVRTQTDTELQTHINDEVNARTQADSELQSKINTKQDKLTAGDNIKIENNVISAIGGGTTTATELLVKIHWAELKALMGNSQLVPGQQYRITDYTCTTTKAATKSAGHVFDIIVTADSTNVLNEEARAIQHDEDTYFTDCDLTMWKLWYCIDNDTNRFDWADATKGKGVIYRMIDEFNNDVAYDFKNIQFYRQWDEAKQLWRTISNDNTGVPCYTFSSIGDSSTVEFTDMSLSASNNVYSNVIKEYISSNKQTLNNNCFFGTLCNKNTFGVDCRENTFGNKCSSNAFGGYCFLNSFGNECNYNSFEGEFNQNSFGSNCSYNLFGSGCYINSFDSYCYLNSFGGGCHENTFGTSCYLNSFGSGCHHTSFKRDCVSNSFGSDCYSNSFGKKCNSNSFGNNCYSNSFGNECNSNSFGNNCYNNTFKNYCNSNSFGNECNYNSFLGFCKENSFGNKCYSNSFGSDWYSNSFENNCYRNSFGSNWYRNSFGSNCYLNSFGDWCSNNSFGNTCKYISFASSTDAHNTKYSFYQNNHFGDGCEYILFKGAETASTSAQVQNYNFAQGLQGTENTYITIDGKRNRAYETYISMGTDETIKESVIAEKQDKLVAGENIKIENNVISAIGGGTTGATELLVKITWTELKSLRDNSQLVAGQQYRITDYTCTTTKAATKSAGHVFDIIVTADDENTLNEVARAIQHDGDTYFADSNLSAWKIWYCIDNDTNRFTWADSVNGKGVIYRMIDECNNDVPYDFKNIQFYRQWDSNTSLWSTISKNNTGVPCYTFSSDGDSSTVEFTDMSLSISNNVYSNVIKEYIISKKQTLNNNCFFGNVCKGNSFGGDCYNNSFGHGCYDNSFGSYCYGNSFGFGCVGNMFDRYCSKNTFVSNCLNNKFGSNCDSNSFGDICCDNSFGADCSYNSFGDSCSNNSFGNDCSYIKFASDSPETTKYGHYQNNHFGDGCEYIVFTGAEDVANAREIKNYNFAQGLQGTADNYLIVEGKRNRAYETKVAKNSSGTLKIYCEADLSK